LVTSQDVLFATQSVGEKVSGVQRVVAKKFEHRTVEFIRSAFGYDADLATGSSSKLGGRDAGLNGEFLHCIRDWKISQRGIDLCIDVADAIEQKVVRLRPRTGYVEPATLHACCGRHDTGRDQSEIQILTSVKRHIRDGPAVDDGAQSSLVC